MDRIKELRKERGLTQAALAEMSGIDQAFISKIEAGEANPTMDKIKVLAECLGVEPPELFTLSAFKRTALAALGAITDPERQAAAMVVLRTMADKPR